MKKNFLIITAFSVVLGFTACKNNDSSKEDTPKSDKGETEVKKSTTSSGSGEINISTPNGFTRIDTTTMGRKSIFLMSDVEGKSDVFKENLNVLSEKVGSMGLESYMTLTTGNMDKMLTNYKQVDLKDMTVDGVPAKSLDYTHSMGMYDLAVNAVVLIKNETAYVITSTAQAGSMNKWKPKFDEAIASFHVD